jgi:hypothetical protein
MEGFGRKLHDKNAKGFGSSSLGGIGIDTRGARAIDYPYLP